MCVIIYKPEGVKMPSAEILKNCYLRNKDGIGMCVRMNNNEFEITKGLWEIDSFNTYIKSIKKDLINKEVVIHFRLASEGSVSPDNCHPFMTKNGNVLFHNGTIRWLCDYSSIYDTVYNKKEAIDTKTDTEKFIEYINAVEDKIDNEKIQKLIAEATNSKFVIMTKENTYLIGEFSKLKGCYYSNLYWQPILVKTTYNHSPYYSGITNEYYKNKYNGYYCKELDFYDD